MPSLPSYRGVGKRSLIASVKQAAAFLKKLNLGPDTNRTIDRLLGQNTIDKLESARSDLSLIVAVRDTDIRSTLTEFAKVIRLHALADEPDAKGNTEALDLYERLMSWSAFFPSREKRPPSPMDEEIRTHLLSTMAHLLGPEDEDPNSAAQQGLSMYMQGIKEEEELLKEKEGHDNGGGSETARWLTEAIPLVAELGRLGGSEAEIQEILRGNKLGASLMPLAFEVMLGLDMLEKDLGLEPPITKYKVVFDRVGTKADEIRDQIVDAGDVVLDLMSPFFFNDEIEKDIDVDVENDGDAFSISVYTTREGAQHLANNLPANMRVTNSKGQKNHAPAEPSPAAADAGFLDGGQRRCSIRDLKISPVFRKSSMSVGLETNCSTPSLPARSRSRSAVDDVRIAKGTPDSAGFFFIASTMSKPSYSGRFRSMMIRSGRCPAEQPDR